MRWRCGAFRESIEEMPSSAGSAVRLLGVALLVGAGVAGAAGGAPSGAARDTVLVSRATGAQGAKARGPFYAFHGPSHISLDGRFVTFSSQAPNLDPDDGDEAFDAFLRDVREDVTTLVSRADGPLGAKGNGESLVGDAIAAGRYVVFNSVSTNLDPADTDTVRDIFLRDLETADTVLISRADGAAGAKGNGEARRGRVSADGRFVALDSTATNLDPADSDADRDVFVRDVATHDTALVTSGVEGAELAAFSDDGNHVAFRTPDGGLYVQDLLSGSRAFVAVVKEAGISLSGDGRRVAFSSSADLDPADRDRAPDVYVRDLRTGATTLVNRGAVGGSLSANGRYVAFTSGARLVPVDTPSDHASDVYVRDLRLGRTMLADRSASGAKGNESAGSPALSGDGRYVTFMSRAHNLDPVDRDYRHDVYVRDLRARLPAPGRPPRSRIGFIRIRGGMSATGRASDDGEVQVVEVSLTRRLPSGRCERWNVLWVRTPARGGRCRPRFDLAAHFTRRWWRRFDGELRPGRYELLTRAVDTAGQREQVFSVKRGNRRAIEIR